MRKWISLKVVIIILQICWNIVQGEPLVGDMEEILNDSNVLSDFETEEFENADYRSWSGINALARAVLLERHENLQKKCDRILDTSPRDFTNYIKFRNILVDEKNKLLYCYVPKAACTNWKRLLMIISGKWVGNDPLEIPGDKAHTRGTFPSLSNYSLPEIMDKIVYYDKLIVVRHPLERLLSAYLNKFMTNNVTNSKYFLKRFGGKIIKNFRANATKEEIDKANDVTFGEFVDFITDKKRNNNKNEHWCPYSDLCHPCIINYNLISKYETLVDDASEILERIGAPPIPFPGRNTQSLPTVLSIDKYYSTLSLKQLQKLSDYYKSDLNLFDYSLEEIIGFSVA